MNNLISNSINHPGPEISLRPISLPERKKRSLLLALAAVCVAGMLSVHDGASAAPPSVTGAPRLAHVHPDTLWDKEDVAEYKLALTTNPALKTAFDELKAAGDERITEPINVPEHHLDADGTWTYPEFKRGSQDASGNWQWEWVFNGILQKRAEDVSNLGILYALTGDEKYADFARQILLSVADAYGYGKGSKTPDPHGFDHFEAYGFDGGDIAMFLAKACQGYDLIYGVPSVAKDRTRIEGYLIRPLAEHLNKRSAFMYTTHDRWGMVCLYGMLIAGETLNDPALIDLALYGQDGSKDKVTGGFMDVFKPGFLHDAVIWGAGPKLDDKMAALSVMTAVAEVLWHHNVDLYSYNDAALKHSYDAALTLVTNLDASSLHALPGVDSYPYAFRRYHDERYLSVIHQIKPSFMLAIGEHLPSPPATK